MTPGASNKKNYNWRLFYSKPKGYSTAVYQTRVEDIAQAIADQVER